MAHLSRWENVLRCTTEPNAKTGIYALPIELLYSILDHLSYEGITRLARTQRSLYNVCIPYALRRHPAICNVAFLWACMKGYHHLVRHTIAAGTPVDHVSAKTTISPLKTFNWELEDGEQLYWNWGTSFEIPHSGLALALTQGHVEVFNVLVEHGVSLEKALCLTVHVQLSKKKPKRKVNGPFSNFELSPFHLVRHEAMYQALLSAGHKFSSSLPQKFNTVTKVPLPASILSWMILRKADTRLIQSAVRDGGCEWDGKTRDVQPLVLACQKGDLRLVSALLESNFAVTPGVSWKSWRYNAKQNRLRGYNSALWYAFVSAIYYRCPETESNEKWCNLIDMFVAHGLDVNKAVRRSNEPSLLHVSMLPHVPANVLNKLIDMKADPTREASFRCKEFQEHCCTPPHPWGRHSRDTLYDFNKRHKSYFSSAFEDLYQSKSEDGFSWSGFSDTQSIFDEYGGPIHPTNFRPESLRVMGHEAVTPLDVLFEWSVAEWRMGAQGRAEIHRHALNQLNKIPILLRGIISAQPGSIKDALRWASRAVTRRPNAFDDAGSISDTHPMLLLSHLGMLVDLKDPKYAEDLRVLENTTSTRARCLTGTLENVAHWAEVLAHHKICFPLTTVDKGSAVSWACQGAVRAFSPCHTVFHDKSYRDMVQITHLPWNMIDMDLTTFGKFHQVFTEAFPPGIDTGERYNWLRCESMSCKKKVNHPPDCYAAPWEKFKIAHRIDEHRLKNTERILRACFQLDLDLDIAVDHDNVKNEERWLEREGLLEGFLEEMAVRKARAEAAQRNGKFKNAGQTS